MPGSARIVGVRIRKRGWFSASRERFVPARAHLLAQQISPNAETKEPYDKQRRSPAFHHLLGASLTIHAQDQTSFSQGTDSGSPDSAFQTAYTVTERGLHHRVLERVVWFTNAAGVAVARTNSYTELATGMAHMENGRLVDSTSEITITPTGAEATNAMHSVRFLGNLNAGPVQVTLPDGQQISSRVLGISYFDWASQKSVFVAETKDSFGQLLPSRNQALYPDAFTEISADLLYVNSIAGCEQLVVLREQPPSPAEWGLDPATTYLQVISEFSHGSPPRIPSRIRGLHLQRDERRVLRARSCEQN